MFKVDLLTSRNAGCGCVIFAFFIQVQENLGMVMVFTIVSALQEKLTVMVEDAKRLAEEQRIQKEKDDEEAALVVN